MTVMLEFTRQEGMILIAADRIITVEPKGAVPGIRTEQDDQSIIVIDVMPQPRAIAVREAYGTIRSWLLWYGGSKPPRTGP